MFLLIFIHCSRGSDDIFTTKGRKTFDGTTIKSHEWHFAKKSVRENNKRRRKHNECIASLVITTLLDYH